MAKSTTCPAPRWGGSEVCVAVSRRSEKEWAPCPPAVALSVLPPSLDICLPCFTAPLTHRVSWHHLLNKLFALDLSQPSLGGSHTKCPFLPLSCLGRHHQSITSFVPFGLRQGFIILPCTELWVAMISYPWNNGP